MVCIPAKIQCFWNSLSFLADRVSVSISCRVIFSRGKEYIVCIGICLAVTA